MLCYGEFMHKEDKHSNPQRMAEIEAEARRLTPPSESSTSTVLNGIGNGMMVGTLPFVAMELYHNIVQHGTGKSLPKAAYLGCAFALVGGSAVGAVMGNREAHRLEEYRTALGEEIIDLRMQAEDTNANLKKWQQKLEAHATHLNPSGDKPR